LYISDWIKGSSFLQGPHHVAKKVINTIFPFKSEIFIVFPGLFSKTNSGTDSESFANVVSSCATLKKEEQIKKISIEFTILNFIALVFDVCCYFQRYSKLQFFFLF
jgi:hypothetical protein